MKARHLLVFAAAFAALFLLWIQVATPAPTPVEAQAHTLRAFGT